MSTTTSTAETSATTKVDINESNRAATTLNPIRESSVFPSKSNQLPSKTATSNTLTSSTNNATSNTSAVIGSSTTSTTFKSKSATTIDILTHAPSWPRHSNISLPHHHTPILPPPSPRNNNNNNKSSSTRPSPMSLPKINTTPDVLRKTFKALYRRAIEVRNVAVSNGRQTIVVILFILCVILIMILGGGSSSSNDQQYTTSLHMNNGRRNQHHGGAISITTMNKKKKNRHDVDVQPPIFLPHVRVNPALMRDRVSHGGSPQQRIRKMREHRHNSVRSRAGWIDLDPQHQQQQQQQREWDEEDKQKQKEKDDEDNVMPQNNEEEDEENRQRDENEEEFDQGLRDSRHDDRRRLGHQQHQESSFF